MDAGENPDTVYTAKGNIKADTTDPSEKAYLNYLNQVMDKDAIQQVVPVTLARRFLTVLVS